MISNEGILYIEPSGETSDEPVIDDLTKKMTAAFRKSRHAGPSYRGWHTCNCGAWSSNHDYILPNGEQTNSLCVHYLAYHRNEVPADQLEKVRQLDCGKEEPNNEELSPPKK